MKYQTRLEEMAAKTCKRCSSSKFSFAKIFTSGNTQGCLNSEILLLQRVIRGAPGACRRLTNRQIHQRDARRRDYVGS